MRNLLPLVLTLLAVMLPVAAQQPDKCPLVKMQVERLPNLNVPRIGHSMFCINGEVVAADGHEKELGIGQTFTLEIYDPTSHSFKGYGCLDQKRCFANALPNVSRLDHRSRLRVSEIYYIQSGIIRVLLLNFIPDLVYYSEKMLIFAPVKV